MLLWILLSFGLALGVAIVACLMASSQAERRARRSLYAALGFSEDLIMELMAQKVPVSVQLALARRTSLSSGAPRTPAPSRPHAPPRRDPL